MSDFSRQKHAWLKQVLADRDLSPLAFHLAFALCEFVNRETGDAWPSMPTLADCAHISERSAWRIVRELEKRGHLLIKQGGGRRATNHYQLALGASAGGSKPCQTGRVSKHRNGANLAGFKTEKPCQLRHKTLTTTTQNPATVGRQTLEEPSYEPKDAASGPAGAAFSVSDLPPKSTPESTPKKLPSRRVPSSGNGAARNGAASADPKTGLFARAEEVLGPRRGGLVVKLLDAKGGDIALARAALETSSTKHDPCEYIGGVIRKNSNQNTMDSW